MSIIKAPNFDNFTIYQYFGYIGLSLFGIGLSINGDGVWETIGILCLFGGVTILTIAILKRKPNNVIKGVFILLYYKHDKYNRYFIIQKQNSNEISLPEDEKNNNSKYWDAMYRTLKLQLNLHPEKNAIKETDIYILID